MAFKFVALFALIAVAAAVPVAYQPAPVLVKQYAAAPVYATKQVEYDAPAEYEFNYAVQDDHTGDVKSQQETRKGDHVVGQYSLIDADGYKRIVDYTADDHSGFNAVVRREPLSGYKQVAAPVVQKVYAAAPVTKYLAAAPVVAKYVSAPVTKYVSAPVAYAAAPVAYAAAPVAHYNHGLAPVAQYNHGVAQVAYSAPAHSYHY